MTTTIANVAARVKQMDSIHSLLNNTNRDTQDCTSRSRTKKRRSNHDRLLHLNVLLHDDHVCLALFESPTFFHFKTSQVNKINNTTTKSQASIPKGNTIEYKLREQNSDNVSVCVLLNEYANVRFSRWSGF